MPGLWSFMFILILLIVIVVLFGDFKPKVKKVLEKKQNISNPTTSVRYSNIHKMLGSYEKIVKRWEKIKGCTLGEFICRITLETIFDEKFPNKRYRFLINPETGKALELDGYNEYLKLAFEFQGDQHVNFPNRYHKTKADLEKFLDGCRRDNYKKRKCKEMKIELLLIYDSMAYPKIPSYIASIIPERYDKFRKDLVSESPSEN